MEEMTYIGLYHCGCLMWAAIDTPVNAKEIAKQTSYCVKHGYPVERVTMEAVREMAWKCEEHRVKQGVLEMPL